MNKYNGKNGNGYQPLQDKSGKVPQPPKIDALTLKGWQQENAELKDEVARLSKARFCGRHKHRVAHFCEECFAEVMDERDRLLVLAIKHCKRDHHDWKEIAQIARDSNYLP